MLITSGFDFEGYTITSYRSFITAQTANTGFGFATAEDTVDTMLASAFSQLEAKAKQCGANAILGLDIDFLTRREYRYLAIISGTAVTIQKQVAPSPAFSLVRSLPVASYVPSSLLRPSFLNVYTESGNVLLELQYHAYPGLGEVRTLKADVGVRTVFGDDLACGDLVFSFPQGPGTPSISRRRQTAALSLDDADALSHAVVSVGQYSDGETVYTIDTSGTAFAASPGPELSRIKQEFGPDAVRATEIGERWLCCCGHDSASDADFCIRCGRFRSTSSAFSLDSFLVQVEQLSTAAEILRAFEALGLPDSLPYCEELKKELENAVYVERIYGNSKRQAVKAVRAAMDAPQPPPGTTN